MRCAWLTSGADTGLGALIAAVEISCSGSKQTPFKFGILFLVNG
jgi:hypothetical protein